MKKPDFYNFETPSGDVYIDLNAIVSVQGNGSGCIVSTLGGKEFTVLNMTDMAVINTIVEVTPAE